MSYACLLLVGMQSRHFSFLRNVSTDESRRTYAWLVKPQDAKMMTLRFSASLDIGLLCVSACVCERVSERERERERARERAREKEREREKVREGKRQREGEREREKEKEREREMMTFRFSASLDVGLLCLSACVCERVSARKRER